MRPRKRQNLEKAGWKLGSAKELLGLSTEEQALIDLKLDLAQALLEQRSKRGLTQMQLARLLHSSQSRVAKMEAADASVSVDLLVRALFALGLDTRGLGTRLLYPRKAA